MEVSILIPPIIPKADLEDEQDLTHAFERYRRWLSSSNESQDIVACTID